MTNHFRTHHKVLIFTVIIICTLIYTFDMQAQSRFLSSRNAAMAGGGVSYVTGFEANFINPANLMLRQGRRTKNQIGLASLNVSLQSSLLDIPKYNETFTTGRVIGVEETADYFGSYEDSQTTGFQIDAVPIGYAGTFEKFAISAAFRGRQLTNFNFNRGLGELALLNLNPDAFSTARPVNFGLLTTTFGEFSVGFAMPVWNGEFKGKRIEVFAGIAPKLIVGANFARVDLNSTLRVDPITNQNPEIQHDFSYSYMTSFATLNADIERYISDRNSLGNDISLGDYVDDFEAGDLSANAMGFGLDLGLTAKIDLDEKQSLTLGFSITDIGSITFSEGVSEFGASDVFSFRGFDYTSLTDNDDYLEQFSDSLSNDIYGIQNLNGTSFGYALPTLTSLAVTYQRGNSLMLSMDLMLGANNSGMNSKNLAMALGVEYRPLRWLPLRGGVRMGGVSFSNVLSFGTGFEFKNVELTFAFMNVQSLKGYVATAFSGLIFRF